MHSEDAHFTGVPDTNSPGSQEPRISKTESTAHVSDLTSDKFCRFRPIVQNSVLPRYGSPAINFNASKCKVLTVTRKKNPMRFDYHLGHVDLQRVNEEKDLGVMITSKLTWETQVLMVSAKATKLLGLLRRTCPMLTDVKVRRSLNLALVKSQMSYVTEVWSPSHSTLKQKAERVQRRSTRWILQIKQGELSYKERLIHLDLLPLTYDREVKDLVFLYKALYGYIGIDISFIKSVSRGHTRSQSSDIKYFETPFCKTATYQENACFMSQMGQ